MLPADTLILHYLIVIAGELFGQKALNLGLFIVWQSLANHLTLISGLDLANHSLHPGLIDKVRIRS